MDPAGHDVNGISVTFGIIQVLFYIDFAWVYYTRQRVKLRNGGVVDADDIRQGWILKRIFGKHVDPTGDDEESAPALGGNERTAPRRAKWGSRGISVSADDTTLEHEGRSDGDHNIDAGNVDPDAKMQDPDELARALDDDDDDDTLPAASRAEASGVRNDEWRD
jgi:hypothetical protein